MSVRSLSFAPLVSLAAVLVALAPVTAQSSSLHRNGFAGRDPFWVPGDANIKYTEKIHKISDEHCKNAPTSEAIKIEANPPAGAVDAEFVNYVYDTPAAPVTDRLTASVWVKAYRPGVQLKARVVFPKEKDPKNPDAPLTTILPGDTYRNTRQWQPLAMGNVEEVLKKHLPVLHTRLNRAVDPSGAYIDRLILNVYAGQGITEVWIDDLEIGPIAPGAVRPETPKAVPAVPVGRAGVKEKRVEFKDGQIQVEGDDGKLRPFFMLGVRHSDTPLKTLRDAQINTVWFPNEVTPDTVDEAVRHGFWVVPQVPLPSAPWDGFEKSSRIDPQTLERDANRVAGFLRKYLATDAVLMWDLGTGRTAEEVTRIARAAAAVREVDPKRARAVDVWDGFQSYGSYVDALGTHRWPLFTSLEMNAYKDWLAQRKALTPPSKMSFTWVQTHLPEWYVNLIAGKPDVARFDDPIGPQPEQIRILTYLALAAGNRGIGYWSDRYLANTHHGRDRLLELALLNSEIEMLKPVLFAAEEPAKWIRTSDGNVQAAILRGANEVLVLPVWLGYGTQYVPPQGALSALTVKVPLVPDGAIPWLVTPAGISEIKGVRRVAGGTEITIPEFDLTAAVVFTSDLKVDGKVVRWQDHTRFRIGELAARWAHQQAIEQFNKALAVHQKICQSGGPDIAEAADLFDRAKKLIDCAQEFLDARQWDTAYRDSRRALRPIRVIMREHWRKAVEPLDVPTASPYAVSFYSLPLHWAFAKDVASSKPGTNALVHGQFELNGEAPKTGAAVSSLPGWSTRQSVLDNVVALARILNSKDLEDKPVDPGEAPTTRYANTKFFVNPDDLKMRPSLGKHCLNLNMEAKVDRDSKGNPLPPPQALERAFLAVDSPAADLPPGSIARISFWVKITTPITASADGLVCYDSVGGEPLALRLSSTPGWKQYHLYRRVPTHGKVAVTFALTGLGSALIDDVQIVPLLAAGQNVTAVSR